MILLTNTGPQTIPVGGSVAFDTVIFQSGNGECHRNGSGTVTLRAKGIYALTFSGNIGGTAAGPVELTVEIGGEPLAETTMDSVTAAAGDLANVSTTTAVRTCCTGTERVTVVNTGDAELTVENPTLFVRRLA